MKNKQLVWLKIYMFTLDKQNVAKYINLIIKIQQKII